MRKIGFIAFCLTLQGCVDVGRAAPRVSRVEFEVENLNPSIGLQTWTREFVYDDDRLVETLNGEGETLLELSYTDDGSLTKIVSPIVTYERTFEWEGGRLLSDSTASEGSGIENWTETYSYAAGRLSGFASSYTLESLVDVEEDIVNELTYGDDGALESETVVETYSGSGAGVASAKWQFDGLRTFERDDEGRLIAVNTEGTSTRDDDEPRDALTTFSFSGQSAGGAIEEIEMERYPAEVRQRLYTLSYDDEEKVVGVDAEGLSITLTYGDDGTELAGLVIGLPAQVEGGGYVDLRGQVHAERSTDRVLLQSY